jgi:hypothetical protein
LGGLVDAGGLLIETGRVGLDWLTGRAERKVRWIGLCGRERATLLTTADMADADARLSLSRPPNETAETSPGKPSDD